MATLSDLKEVLESIDTSMSTQNNIISSMLLSQDRLLESQERQSQLVKADRTETSSTGGAIRGAAAGTGNILGGAGNLLSGLGKGVGFAGAGIGAALLGLSTVIGELPNAQEVKNSVETLLSIGDGYESRLDFFMDGGTLSLILTGLGVGLASFAVGTGVTAGVQYAIEKFEMGNWAETVKENVLTLLSIGDELNLGSLGLLAEGAALTVALTGLGVGLAAFAVGSGAQAAVDYFSQGSDWAENIKNNVNTLLSIGEDKPLGALQVLGEGAGVSLALIGLGAGLAAFSAGQGVQSAVDYMSNAEWAQNVKDNVETLLSISDLQGIGLNTAGFVASMTGLAAGLTIFALGKGVDTTIEGYDQALNYFTSGDDFADRVYNQVETLLQIPQLPGVGTDTAKFVATMGGLALGLAAFALGKGVEGLSEGSQEALGYFTGQEPFAERIKNEVTTLLSITDVADEGKATLFATSMVKIATGLAAIGTGEFVGSLAAAGASILGFFSGAESPFEQVRQIYQNSDQLERGADALDRLAISLERIGQLQFDGSRLRLKQMASDLKDAVPIIEAAIMGQAGGLIFGTAIKGLASPDVDYETATRNIVMLRNALSGSIVEGAGINGLSSTDVEYSPAISNVVAPRQALEGVIGEDTLAGMATVNNAGSATSGPATAQVAIIAPNNSQTSLNSSGGSMSTIINSFGGSSSLDSISRPGGVY